MATIATTIQDILKHLGYTIASQSLEKYQAEVVPDLWLNELGRLRVWTANLEAHRTGQSSLDFRLREASHLKDQILRVLGRLQRTIQDLEALLHEHGPHEEYLSSSDDYSDDDKKDDQTEIQKIYHALHDTISILFDNAVAIRRPAQHDRLLGVKRSDTADFEPYDRNHVAEKFPSLDSDIRDRLGLAISQRRATLRYRERHHLKLAQGLDSVEDTVLSKTVATELIEKHTEEKFELQSTSSQTSYAKTIMNGREGMVVPPPPQEFSNGNPFECPYCFLLVQIDNRHSWIQHVFHDLMPYVCVFPNCRVPHRLFESRREWYVHLQNEHSVPHDMDSLIPCPLCGMSVGSAKPFERHLGRHLQELALFALPRSTPDEDKDHVTSTEPEHLEDHMEHIPLNALEQSSLDGIDEVDTLAKPKISTSSSRKVVNQGHISSAEKPDRFKCKWDGCKTDRDWGTPSSLLRHTRAQHLNPNGYRCPHPQCGTSFGWQEGLRKHMHSHDIHSEPQQISNTESTQISENIPERLPTDDQRNGKERCQNDNPDERELNVDEFTMSDMFDESFPASFPIDRRMLGIVDVEKSEHRPENHHERAEPHDNTHNSYLAEFWPTLNVDTPDDESDDQSQQPSQNQYGLPSKKPSEYIDWDHPMFSQQ